jgi:hypothetical protein
LLFRLLIVATGHESKFVTKVDPAAGEQVVSLKPLSREALKSRTRITGVVVGEDGKPVVGAVISPQGVGGPSSTQWGGTNAFVDPLAIADDQGHFLLLCKADVDTVHATVDGPNVAQRWVELKPGRDHLIRMQEGVAISGRVERGGEALKDVLVGLATTDRAAGNFFHCDELATGKDGRFLILNVPPEREFVLYSTMGSLGERGFTPPKVFSTRNSGTTIDVGQLAVQPGHRLMGQIVLSDGQPVPPNTRLLLGRRRAWDYTEVEPDANGRFEFAGVPPESVNLSVRISGYRFSRSNPSLDWLNGRIVGSVNADVTDLTLLLEPGQWQFGDARKELPAGAYLPPYDKPLRGVRR